MSELRQDRTTGAWVIVAPERRDRPRSGTGSAQAAQPRPGFDPGCPFCPGNEAALPGILEEVRAEAGSGWAVRVVPNKYPALRPDAAPFQPTHAGAESLAGYGHHEVVIESPRHDVDLASLSDSEIEAVLATYRRRFVWLSGQPRIARVILFRNHGPSSGASLAHPHAQLIALPMVPPDVQAHAAVARAWCEQHGRCVLCDEMERERADGRRVLAETGSFTAFVPFAAACPFETWIVPRRHQASFAETERAELREMGLLLRDVLCRLKSARGDPPYNLVVDSAGPAESDRPDLHWRLRIAPGLATPGGFELGSGMRINPSSPEDDAGALRAAEGYAPRR